MIVAKRFNWEAAHRLPWHEGKCKQIHGHSYKMIVEFDGELNEKGMVVDFNDIKKMIEPIVKQIDHATIISSNDTELKELFEAKSWKYFLLPFDSTAENLCNYFLGLIIEQHKDLLVANRVKEVGVKVFETDTTYAYTKATLK